MEKAGSDGLAGSRRVSVSHTEYSRSGKDGIRYGPRTPRILAAKTIKIGGGGRNRPFTTAIAGSKWPILRGNQA